MKVSIAAKRVVILLMTMALAVAMVACSAAAGKPGPAGPQGPKGDPGDTTTTPPPDQTPPPGESGPVQVVKPIGNFVFNDDMDGNIDLMQRTVMLADHFHGVNLEYSLEGYSSAEKKRVDATVENDMLTVMLKDVAKYQNNDLTVKATDGTSIQRLTFHVRRNNAPLAEPIKYETGGTVDATMNMGAMPFMVWVGTEDEVTIETGDPATQEKIEMDDTIAVAIDKPLVLTSGLGFFQDDMGDKLTFEPEALAASHSKMLMVTGGGEVTLLGKKTTKGVADGIPISLIAIDTGKLRSDEVTVMMVKVDTAPKKKAGASIPTQRIVLASSGDVQVLVDGTAADADLAALQMLFEDDYNTGTDIAPANADTVPGLDIFAWSNSPELFKIVGNSENKKSGNAAKVPTTVLQIIGLGVGEGTITVKAVEAKSFPNANNGLAVTANLEQSATIDIKVVVVEK